jgi:hypothetical protein
MTPGKWRRQVPSSRREGALGAPLVNPVQYGWRRTGQSRLVVTPRPLRSG